MKHCPYCAEEIQDAAIVCRFCRRDLLPVGAGAAPISPPTPAPATTRSAAEDRRRFRAGAWLVVLVVICGGYLAQMGTGTPARSSTARRLDAKVSFSRVAVTLRNPSTATWRNVDLRVDYRYGCGERFSLAGHGERTVMLTDCVSGGGERFDADRRRPTHINVIAYIDGVEHGAAFEP